MTSTTKHTNHGTVNNSLMIRLPHQRAPIPYTYATNGSLSTPTQSACEKIRAMANSTSSISVRHAMSTLWEGPATPHPPDVKALQDLSLFLRYKSLCLIDGEELDLDVVDTNSFMGQLQHVSHVSLCILSYYLLEAYNKQFFLSIISDFFGRERRKMTTRSPAPWIELMRRELQH
jgi:hypothetical protein